jgi:hypothetical protein
LTAEGVKARKAEEEGEKQWRLTRQEGVGAEKQQFGGQPLFLLSQVLQVNNNE